MEKRGLRPWEVGEEGWASWASKSRGRRKMLVEAPLGWVSGPQGISCARVERVGSRFHSWCADLNQDWLRGTTCCGGGSWMSVNSARP